MKKYWLLIFLLSLGCETEAPVPEEGPGKVKVTIDGQAVESKEVVCTLTRPLDEQLTLTSSFDLSGKPVKFILAIGTGNTTENLSEGEYTIGGTNNDTSNVYFYYFAEVDQPIFTSQQLDEPLAGSVTLKEIDRQAKLVSGTFHVKAARKGEVVVFTDGSFSKIPFDK